MTISAGSGLVQNLYGTRLTIEAERGARLMQLVGSWRGAPFRIIENSGAEYGSSHQIRYQTIDDDAPAKGEGDVIVGNEDSANYAYDTINIAKCSITGKVEDVVSEQQRVSIDVRDGEMTNMAGRWSLRWDRWIANQMAAFVPANTIAPNGATVNHLDFGGMNTIAAADAGHILYPLATTADTDLDAAAEAMTDVIIERAAVAATTKTSTRRAFSKAYVPMFNRWLYICIMHPQQFQDFKDSGATTSNSFVSLNEARLAGGADYEGNPLLTGDGGIFNGVLILTSDLIPKGVNGTAEVDNVRRAIFFGADAGCMYYGKGFTDGVHLGWTEHVIHDRYSYQSYTNAGFKVATPSIGGTAQRWASIVLPTYSTV